MKITDALIAEHGMLNVTLEFVAESAPKAASLAEIKLLAGLLERLLHTHAEGEENFVLAPLDHAMEDQGQRNQMHQAHLEIDVRLKEVQSASEMAQARRLLKGAISTTHKHFKYEEQVVFPKCETLMGEEALNTLGHGLFEQRRKGIKED